MKASLFAVVFSSLVICFPVQAALTNPLSHSAQAAQTLNAKIDLNKADAKALANSIKGIGQKRAEMIVKYREAHGRFQSLEDLAKVPGFGEKFVKNHLALLQQAFIIK